MKRAAVPSILVVVVVLAVAVIAEAQQPKKVPRIGLLFPGSQSAFAVWTEAFREGLRELGYVEGQNIGLEYHYADEKTERPLDLATELISS